MTTKKNKHIGSSFDSFLEEEGIFAETKALATKAVFAWALQQALDGGMTKANLARKLETSRQQLDRLLDPANTSINLKTMERIANLLHKRLVVTLEDMAA